MPWKPFSSTKSISISYRQKFRHHTRKVHFAVPAHNERVGDPVPIWRLLAETEPVLPPDRLMTRMNGVVEIDAGQNCKHVGLQERDQQFERSQRDGQRQRQDTADPTDRAE